jgi:hypothetical protein
MQTDVSKTFVVSSYPYFESFAAGKQGWRIDNNGSASWAFGEPNKTVIKGAYSDTNAFVIGGLSGNYAASEYGFVYGPCFDFSTLIRPQIQLKVWFESEAGWDGANVHYTTDDGATWYLLGNFDQGENWYNEDVLNGMNGLPGWAGRNGTGSNGWLTATIDASQLGGQSDVKLRVAFASDGSIQDEGFAFDDFSVFEAMTIGNDTVLCTTDTLTLDPGMYPGGYLWSDSTTSQLNYLDASVMPAGTDTIYVVTSSLEGYKQFDTVVVTVEKPVVNLGADSVLCYGTSTTLDAGLGFATYLWSEGSTTQTIVTSASTVGSTNYSVIAVTPNNCPATDSVDVSVNTEVLVNLGVDTIFSDSNLQDTFYELDAGAGFSSYLWNDAAATTTRKLIIDSNNDGEIKVVVTNVSGCEGSDSVMVDFRLGVGSNLTVSTITMYPNPTSDVINIEVSNFNNLDNVNVTILDLSGKVVMTNKLEGNGNSFNQTYDVSSFATGTYFVQFEANGEVITRQFIIK